MNALGKVVYEIESQNLNYKAIIRELPDGKHEISCYEWENHKSEEEPLWKRIGHAVITDTIGQAQALAQNQLEEYFGQRPESWEVIEPTIAKKIRENFPHALPLKIKSLHIYDEETNHRLNIQSVFHINDLYLVQKENNSWSIAYLNEDEHISLVKTFVTLHQAIKEMKGLEED